MKRPLLKILLICGVAAALAIPVAMIQGLVAERQARSQEAVAGIAEGWGKRQRIANPYLAVPYERHWTEVTRETADGKVRERRTERSEPGVLRLPAETVAWSIGADISEKARGIYRARLYSARLDARGRFALPARASFEDGSSRYKWGAPRLVVGISDPHGIRAAPAADVNGARYAFMPGTADAPLVGGVHAPLPGVRWSGAQAVEFAFALELGGSESFAIAPLGSDTAVAMRADWPHPSFQGRFLPARSSLGSSGFEATWQVSRFAAQSAGRSSCAWPCSVVGQEIAVSFIETAGLYQRLERASKYGFLFIGLTFAAFVLVELLRRLAIHPVQYALVGLALAMFFLLLTALSEHIDFALAYAGATLACVGLVTAYVVRVLRSARSGIAFGVALTCVYAMLYALLNAEDYSLLGGALLLFALLAAVMLGTRRVDWYALGEAKAA